MWDFPDSWHPALQALRTRTTTRCVRHLVYCSEMCGSLPHKSIYSLGSALTVFYVRAIVITNNVLEYGVHLQLYYITQPTKFSTKLTVRIRIYISTKINIYCIHVQLVIYLAWSIVLQSHCTDQMDKTPNCIMEWLPVPVYSRRKNASQVSTTTVEGCFPSLSIDCVHGRVSSTLTAPA